MEEMSTLHAERPEPMIGRMLSGKEKCRESVVLQNQPAYFTVRIISYLWGLISGRFLQLQMNTSSQTPRHSSMSMEYKPIGIQQSVKGLAEFDREPPDILESGPPGIPRQSLKRAFIFIAQQPMNEQFILNKSPHEPSRPAVSDMGGGPIAVRPKSLAGGNFNQLLSSFGDCAHGTTMPIMKGALAVFSLMLLWLVSSSAQAQTSAKINLSLHKTISSQSPAIGDVVTYTVAVANAPGSTTATNVSVTDNLPVGGVAFIPGSATIVRGTGTYTPTGSTTATVGTWTIPSIAPGDSAVVVLKATVLERGVWFNTAEVTAADQTDTNSIPNNQSLTEDDYDAVCFSVPILWYVGDEYTVTIPSGYDQIVWYRDNTPISSSAVSTSLAQVNGDLSLTIKSPGTYRFVTYRNGCPATNCCDIQVIQGPYGSLGDYVWVDTNKDGAQETGEPGIDGVKVYLYDQTGTTKLDSTVTAGGGKYLFDSLTDGSYVVRFISPTGYQSTSANVVGVSDSLDSDAGVNGFTGVYTIDTSQPISSTARNNPTVDAGFYLPSAGLGDYVFADNNKDGIQNTGDTPIAGAVVTLYTNGVASATTVTNASGFYSFTGLTPGSSTSYSVGFTTPSGYTATLAHQGTDGALDSDADIITGKTQSVTLAPGEFNPTLDAGFYIPSAGLGDYVFFDANKDGIQNTGDTPIAGAVVTLYTNGVASATTVTNASGFYSFTGLTPGSSTSYSVGFTTPSGYTATLAHQGTDGALDSDADIITGKTQSVTLAPGEFNPTLDAGFYIPSAGLGDYVFFDANKDGIQNTGDTPIANVLVTLYTNGVASATTVTNASGFYSFTGLTPGSSTSYSVGFTTPSGYTATLAHQGTDGALDSDADIITGKTQSVTLAPGEFNPTLDAGFYIPSAGLGDYVFADNNHDGIQDTGDTPIAGAVVTLYTNGVASATTVTNASGFYSFTGLTPGSSTSYSVGFTTPSGYTATLAHQGTDGALDSDADIITGKTQSVTLAPGEFNPTLDAGFYIPSAGLGDYVFFDANKDGIQNTGDTPIANVLVTLYTNGVASATTVTNASGFYSFTGLTPGSSTSYSVGFTTPSGYTATLAHQGTDGALDSDADIITGKTQSVTLAPGEFNPTLDAGFYIPSAGLGDYVFADNNHDGIQDTGDTPIAGAVVTLYTNGVASATTVTNASGFYSFTGLTPGSSTSYSVGFTTPSGYTATLAHQGTDGALDSDADIITGKTQSVTLAPGEFNPTLDAGFYIPSAGLGDYVFFDANKDGIQNTGDTPIAGAVVTLYTNGVASATTVTNASGFYSFTGLTPGSSTSYSVGFTTPSGYTATLAHQGTDGALDSDADIITGKTQSVTLAPGEFNPTLDAGFYIPSAGLGDYVFADNNHDGIQDTGDTPIAGAVVTLYTNGVASATTVTNASGFYSFTGLTPGSSTSYSVGFTTPSGYTATLAHQGTDGALDSDADIITGKTQSVTLAPGEFNPTLDAGFYIPSAGLGDYVFFDANKDGIQNTGDTPIAGAVVTLYTNGVASATTVTNASGFYSFTGLTPGSSTSYSVGFTTPSGYTATLAHQGTDGALDSDADIITGKTQSVTLAPGEFNPTLDAGFYIPSAGLGDYVFFDANKDGIQNTGDTPIANVLVTLYTNGVASATTVTNASGFYSFTGLTPGSSTSYSVGFTTPSGYAATLAHQGTDGALDSDADIITGKTQSVTLAPGEFNPTLDAGFYIPSAGLGDYVFADNNQDGIQDTGDTPIAGVVVTLYTNGVASATTVTNASGFYSFTGLTPGSSTSYSVGFTTPSGYTATLAHQGTDGALDSDADIITGKTQSVTLAPGEFNPTLDAGFYIPSAGLGDYVFFDANKDGIQNTGDTPIANVLVTLYTNGVASATTVTNASGFYSFTGLTPGSSTSYSVGFTTPSGYTATLAHQGTDGALDSDADIITGKTQSVTLAPGEFNPTLDAGFYIPSAGLGDYVFADNNQDGIQNTGDTPIAGAVVTLYTNGVASATTVTNASGFYSFTGLTPGSGNSYSVGFTAPSGYTATLTHQGTNNALDSDVDPIIGRTQSVTLAPGEFNPTLDAGFRPTCPVNFSLVVSNDAAICNGDVVTLTATTSVTAAQIRWYLTPYDGVAFATTSNGASLTVNPTTTTVYYAEAFTTDGCVSARKPVVVQVTTVPTPICLGSTKNTCPDKTVDLTQIQVENHSSGLTYEWYTSIDRSVATRVTNLTAVGGGKYYLFAKSGNCYSNPTVLTVEIVDCSCQSPASVTANPGLAICYGDVVPLKAVISGSATSVVWSTSGTGSFSNPTSLTTTYTASKADSAAGSVLITVTTNDPDGDHGICAPSTYSLIIKINKRPAIPFGVACDDTLVCQGSSTKLIGFVPNGKINWYDENGTLLGTVVSGGKLIVTPAKAGAVVYYAEAVSAEGCVSPRSSLTITVGQCLADLAVVKTAVTPQPYSVGQKITYSITASNNGPITGTDVKVTDILPSTLTYVSSTPAGQYSPATGVWTIGTLTNGSDRVLLIEATVNGTGSIKNTAIIGGSNNDPRYPGNDTSSVTIPVNPCNVLPPTIVCAITDICKGGTTTLSAKGCDGGTVIWSDGHSGTTIFTTPSITTIYTASCVIGSCTSVASAPITVVILDPKPPVITASADNVCPGTSVTLTAAGCEGGTIEWSDKAQTGASIVVTPYGKTNYTAQCRLGSCLSNPAIITINIASDLPTPTISCSTTVVCPGETMTLTVNNCVGTPIWNSTTATTSSIIVTPTLGDNAYSVYCKNDACVSKSSAVYTIKVVAPVIPTVTASADTICAGGSVILTAADCNGTVQWSTGQTGASISVSPTANISYYAQCKFRSCLSAPSNTVSIAVVSPQVPIVKVSKTLICSGEVVSLTATGCNGAVQWHGVDKVGATITIYPTATTDYYATCKQGTCVSDASNKVRVTVNTSPATAPTITASTLAVCNGGLVSLTATGCDGTVQWSDGQLGAVISVTATAANHEFYALCKPTSSTQCGTGKSNVININVTPTPTPSIVRCLCSADTICPGETVKLSVKNCQGTAYWSTGETTTSIVVSPTVTTAYTVYCQDGVCKSASTDPYKITVIPVSAPTITASATVVAPGSTVTLSASGCAGTVIWSSNDINGNNKGASIVVKPEGTQTYYAQCQYHECLSDPSITIIINPGNCVAKAGTLVPVSGTVCGGTSTTVTVAATLGGGLIQPTGYSVVYLLTKGGVVQQTSTTPQFTVSSDAAAYTINTLVYNATSGDQNYFDLSKITTGVTKTTDVIQLIGTKCADLDAVGATVNVNVVAPPVLSAGPSITACSGTIVSLTATGCLDGVVKWSDGSIGATIQKTVYSDLSLLAICSVNGCESKPSTSVQITLASPAVPIIVSDQTAICTGGTVSLTATGCQGGTYVWSDGTTVGSVLTVTPLADVSYRVKCKIGTCEGDWSATTTIKVGKPNTPTISIAGGGTSTTVCYGAPVTLVAEGCSPNSYVTWSNNLVGTSITVSLASSATFTAQCCNSTQCKSDPSNTIAVTVLSKVPQPTVVDKTNTCPILTVDLSTAVSSAAATTGGVFEYYTDASLSSDSKVANPAAVGTGTYYVVERTVNGCLSLPVAIHVQIITCTEPTPCDATNPATANAGPDASICAAKSYQLSGVMGGAGKTAHWTTSGSGNFDNSYALNAVYTASAEDALSGKVTLTLTVTTNNTACAAATDDLLLTIEGGKTIPVVIVAGATNLCYGDSVTLKAPDGASGYKWSDGETKQNIVVKQSGVYSVQLIDAKGCSSIKSDNVVVKVADPVLPPLVTNLRNTCPSKIVDLTTALSTTNVGSSYIYRICECNTSNIVIRPDSVCDGTYWIVEKSASGCLSKPSKVVVKVFNCAADTLNADVSIAKTVSKAFVKTGEPVTYTITVSNAGPHTAKNIDVRDVLPKGLELVPASSPSYKVSNGVITQTIDSLKAGDSKQIVFAAHVLVKGQDVVNKAEITYLDNKDTNLANNTSSVTVKDTSTNRASLIGIAKAVLGQPKAVGDSLINVSYSFVVTNFGDDTLRHVQVVDDLAYAFSPNTIQSAAVTAGSGSSLKLNPTFSGTGSHVNLFDSTSYLLPGASQTFSLAVVVKRAVGDTTKSFNNIASASAINSLTSVSDLSTSGGDTDPDNDGNPTNNTGVTSFTLGATQPQGPSIGVALAVINVVQLPDSSYNVTYKATIKNFGDVTLKGVSLIDSLSNVFVSPASYSVVGAPVVGVGSTLVANTGFDGSAQANILGNASSLAAGVQDTVVFTVNIKGNGNNGPFYSSATASGHTPDSTQTVKDVSNNGFDPTPDGSVSTTVRFDLPKGLLGVAKSVGTPTLVEEGVYDIPYTIALNNMGSVPLSKVQVEDNLSETFGKGALIVSSQISVSSTGTISVDPTYSGQGLITKMLVDSLSTLAVGAKASLSFTVRVNVKGVNPDSLTFYNTAGATAFTPDSQTVTDVSTAGTNDDPDNDLDPRNNSQPTPIALNSLSATSYIGLAMAVHDTVRQSDGSFNVTYQIVVKAYGPDALKNVTISDSLSKVFNAQTGSTYSVVSAPIITSTGSALKLNPNYNGGSDPVIVLGDSTSTLAAGKVDTIRVVVNVASSGSTTTFLNSAYGQAKAKSGTVSDVSTSGLNPDLNGNGNPTDSNEREATPLNLPTTYLAIFIPEGFSPNNDGINDLFVIRGTAGLTVSLDVYNRWGYLVYKNDNYQNDWDGKPNTGISISSDANGVPDGTYYYVINLSDGRKFVRYMTINR